MIIFIGGNRMRKYIIFFATTLCLLLLSACSEEKVDNDSGVNHTENETEAQSDEPILKNVDVKEELYVETEHVTPGERELLQYNLTINNVEIVDGVTTNIGYTDRHDFVVLDFKLENVGENTMNKMFFGSSDFKFYDKDNVEITKPIMNESIEEEIFTLSDIRPDGVFERKMYIPISKGERPAMMIYSPPVKWGEESDEYIYDLE